MPCLAMHLAIAKEYLKKHLEENKRITIKTYKKILQENYMKD